MRRCRTDFFDIKRCRAVFAAAWPAHAEIFDSKAAACIPEIIHKKYASSIRQKAAASGTQKSSVKGSKRAEATDLLRDLERASLTGRGGMLLRF